MSAPNVPLSMSLMGRPAGNGRSIWRGLNGALNTQKNSLTVNLPRINVSPSVGRSENRNLGLTGGIATTAFPARCSKEQSNLDTPDFSPERGFFFPHRQTDPNASTHAKAAWRGVKTAKELDLPWLKEERLVQASACYKSAGGSPVGSAWCRVNRKLLEKLLTRLLYTEQSITV